jgi:hypothetical protein
MLEFKTDHRLPIAVLRKAPFVYVGPDFRSLPLGILSDIVEHRGRKMQRLNPFTVSRTTEDDGSADILFCFIFFYVNDDDERVVYLTHPIYLANSDESEALEALMTEVERLANFLDSGIIQIELHDQISGSVAFPTSLSFFSYNLDHATIEKPVAAQFKRFNYHEESEVICLDQSLYEFESLAGEMVEEPAGCFFASVSPREYSMVREKARDFPVKSYELTRSDGAFKPTNLPFFEDVAHVARRRSGWLFKKDLDLGYLRWTPNIMEPFLETGNPFPLLNFDALEGHAYRYGNIFDWGLNGEDPELFASLLSLAVKSMRRRGIERFQFSHVDSGQEFVLSVLKDYGFEEAHRIKLLRKEVG